MEGEMKGRRREKKGEGHGGSGGERGRRGEERERHMVEW